MSRPAPQFDRDDALRFLYDRIDYERIPEVPYRARNFKLVRMEQLLARLDDPHRTLRVVHVAGTKGKGSTASMIASILGQAGYRTGLFMSPHLDRLEERMAVDAAACSTDELVELVAAVKPAVDEMDRQAAAEPPQQGPTYFEITTAMAMLHFVRRKVDFAVLEVGLGGRLDSTNVCRPLVSVITSISYDHTKQLGNTLTAIAREKAGIIKPEVPLVSGVRPSEPRRVMEQTALRHNCPLWAIDDDFSYRYAQNGQPEAGNGHPAGDAMPHMDFHLHTGGRDERLDGIALGLLGEHQAANAAVALATVDVLRQAGWEIAPRACRAGLADVRCPARIEIVATRPTVVVDAAHNVASVEALLQSLAESFSHRRRTLVFATTQDKDVTGMLRPLLGAFDRIVLTRYLNNPRGVDPDELGRQARTLCDQHGEARPQIDVLSDPSAAWRHVVAHAQPDDLICIAGSFFIAAELRQLAMHTYGQREPTNFEPTATPGERQP